MRPADAVADAILDRVLAELDPAAGSDVAVLVNGMGGTPLMELYIIARHVLDRLSRRNLTIHRCLVGNFLTALEMAGCSISVIKLNDELKVLLDYPAEPVLFRNF